MSFDALTISAIFVVLFVLTVFAIVSYRTHGRTRVRLKDLETQARLAHTPAGRRLLDAICRLYPNSRLGVDYTLADDGDGRGPYINEWMLAAPQPTREVLEQLMAESQEHRDALSYREKRRAEYPSIWAQLEAAYEARHGNPAAQQAIDAEIARVRAKYPKPASRAASSATGTQS